MASKDIKEIYKKSKELYTNVRTVGKNGQSSKWAYYYCKAILNGKKNVKVITQADAKDITGVAIDKELTKSEYVAIIKKYVAWVEKHKALPNYITVKGKKVKPKIWTAFVGYLFKVYYEKGKLPNKQRIKSDIYKKVTATPSKSTSSVKKTTSTSTSTNNSGGCSNPYVSEPHYTEQGAGYLGQETPYYCGPNSLHQCLRKFGIRDYSQSTLASVAGCTSDGTDHDGLNTAVAWVARKQGIKLSVQWKNFSDFGSNNSERFKEVGKIACQSNKAVFFHIGYEDSGYDTGSTVFGHYEPCDRFNTETKYVRALNSLGERDGYGYYGHLQDRPFSLQAHYISNISQRSVCIITKG